MEKNISLHRLFGRKAAIKTPEGARYRADNLGTRCNSVTVPSTVILVEAGQYVTVPASRYGKASGGEISQETSQKKSGMFGLGV